MTKLIINAYDFGLSEAVNYGIISSYRNGIVKSTTIMPGMSAFEHAIKLLNDYEGLGCGVHMTLSLNRPVLEGHKTIVDEKGNFYRRITNELIIDKDLVNFTSYSLKRMDEYEILISKEIKALLEENNIKITNYTEI